MNRMLCLFVAAATLVVAADLPAYDPSGRTEIPPSSASGTLAAFDSRARPAVSGALAAFDSRWREAASSPGSNVNTRRPGICLSFR